MKSLADICIQRRPCFTLIYDSCGETLNLIRINILHPLVTLQPKVNEINKDEQAEMQPGWMLNGRVVESWNRPLHLFVGSISNSLLVQMFCIKAQ